MKLYDGIPHPILAGNDLLSNVRYDDIVYRIDDIFITEPATPYKERQVISKIGQKRKVNLVMTGTVMNHVNISEYTITNQNPNEKYDMYGETVNFTFFNIRVTRNPNAELYIDNNCLFYGYFKMICVNQGLIDINDYSNISVTYEELREICRGSVETFKECETLTGSTWRFEHKKKGDTNGN